MDPRLLRYYSSELQYLRDVGGAFAKEFPKIAGRLGLDEFDCADPYVERLLEGFAFLTARIQLKLDAEFPRFAQHLFEIIYPHYLAPTPSMTLVQVQPDLRAGTLAGGLSIPRHTMLHSQYAAGGQTVCEYRTAQDVELWPLELIEAKYLLIGTGTPRYGGPGARTVKAALRICLRTTAGLKFSQLTLERLPLYLRGAEQLPMLLHEQLLGGCAGFVVQPSGLDAGWIVQRGPDHVRRIGFEDDDALIPDVPRSFSGYRLLHEYFAFPQRFMFVELTGLGEAVRRCCGNELEITVFFDRHEASLERLLDKSHLALFCTPAINVFPKRCDRLELSNQRWEHHVVPDRTRPTDFEVYQVTAVEGYGTGAEVEQIFLPFYAASDYFCRDERRAYYQLRRHPRVVPAHLHRDDLRSNYIGSEVYLALVDVVDAPYRSDLRQLGISTLCTNRDLPISMPVGVGTTDFYIETGTPISAIRCLIGPTRPRPSYIGGDAEPGSTTTRGDIGWRFISHMSLNYLSLCDQDPRHGAATLRELLHLYAVVADGNNQKQIDGLLSVVSRPITRRIPVPGPIVFGRGLEVTVDFDDAAYEGTGAFLLGTVLERFFAHYVTINGFTETVIRTRARGEIKRWPTRIGQRHVL
jgi:type VI secretion system protein ImpG